MSFSKLSSKTSKGEVVDLNSSKDQRTIYIPGKLNFRVTFFCCVYITSFINKALAVKANIYLQTLSNLFKVWFSVPDFVGFPIGVVSNVFIVDPILIKTIV